MLGERLDSSTIQKHYEDIAGEIPDSRRDKLKEGMSESYTLLAEAYKNLEAETGRRKAAEDALCRYAERYRVLADQERTLLEDNIRQAFEKESLEFKAGGIAHDFNNLLMGIQGNILLMLAKLDTASELYMRLKNIERYTIKGTELTQQLLDAAAHRESRPVPEETPSHEPGMHTETVLLVDDELMVRDVATEMLKSIGCRVIVARNGAEAVELYKEEKHEIDLVILDMIMPQMSGSDTFDRLKKIDPGVNVLLSSGYCLDGQASEMLKLGCRGFIQKPYDIRMLSMKIREITEKIDSADR